MRRPLFVKKTRASSRGAHSFVLANGTPFALKGFGTLVEVVRWLIILKPGTGSRLNDSPPQNLDVFTSGA